MTMAEILHQLGDIAPERLHVHSLLGQATEADWQREMEKGHLCELIDGMLVEKPMGNRESRIASMVNHLLMTHVLMHNLGVVLSADGAYRLGQGQVRSPDVSFVAYDSVPHPEMLDEPIYDLAPDLAIEVLSQSNTYAEMLRKRQDYFDAGCRLVWEVDPELRIVSVYTSPTDRVTLIEADVLTGGDVLPGFLVPVQRIFEKLSPRS